MTRNFWINTVQKLALHKLIKQFLSSQIIVVDWKWRISQAKRTYLYLPQWHEFGQKMPVFILKAKNRHDTINMSSISGLNRHDTVSMCSISSLNRRSVMSECCIRSHDNLKHYLHLDNVMLIKKLSGIFGVTQLMGSQLQQWTNLVQGIVYLTRNGKFCRIT